MCYCKKCMMIGGVALLVLGILFLLEDLRVLSWSINWWTALFIVIGIGHLASSKCDDCEAVRNGKASRR